MSRANFLRSLDSGRAVRYSDRPAESAGPRLGADFQDASASARPILAGGARNGETATSSRRSPERGGSRVPGRRGRRWHPRAWRSPRVEEGGQLHISNFRRNIWRPAAADANLPGLRITTFVTRRSPCGSPPGPRPRRSRPAPATPRSASCSTATATCSRGRHRAPGRLDSLFRAAPEHRRNTVA
jgi:hypothetical protein